MLARLPRERVLGALVEHGERFTMPEFLAMMTRHIVWPAAAAYYRSEPVARSKTRPSSKQRR